MGNSCVKGAGTDFLLKVYCSMRQTILLIITIPTLFSILATDHTSNNHFISHFQIFLQDFTSDFCSCSDLSYYCPCYCFQADQTHVWPMPHLLQVLQGSRQPPMPRQRPMPHLLHGSRHPSSGSLMVSPRFLTRIKDGHTPLYLRSRTSNGMVRCCPFCLFG